MSRFVLDCSVAMGWCFLDEVSPYAASVLQAMSSMEALVPAIWPLEVSNAILVGERRGRLTEAELAMREGLPLATLDDKLRAAAQKLGIKELRIRTR